MESKAFAYELISLTHWRGFRHGNDLCHHVSVQTSRLQPVICSCNGNGGTLQPLGWRFESPRTNIHVVPKRAVCARKWRRRKW